MLRSPLLLLFSLGFVACAAQTPAPSAPVTDLPPPVSSQPPAAGDATALAGATALPGAPSPSPTAQAAAAPPAPGGSITKATVADGTALSGHLSREEIKAVVLKNGDLFGACYTLGAGKSKQFVATVTVKATVGPTGVVNEAQVTKSTAKNAKVDGCVADAFKRIKFPTPKDGATSVITFPIEFKGMDEVPGP